MPKSTNSTNHTHAIQQEACVWLARLWSEDASHADQLACKQWRDAHPSHELAWQKVLQLQHYFDAILDVQRITDAFVPHCAYSLPPHHHK